MPSDLKTLAIWIIVAVIIVFLIIKLWPVVIGGPLL